MSNSWVTDKPPILKIPISCNFVPRSICSFHNCGNGRLNRRKSVNTFILAITIKTLLISIQSALTLKSQTPIKGLHWKIIVIIVTAV